MESIDFEQVIYKWLNPQLKDLDEKLHEKTDLFVFCTTCTMRSRYFD